MIRKLILLAICVAAIGIYRGWFTVSSPSPSPTGDRVDFNVSVDARKMDTDTRKAEQKVARKLQEFENTQPGR